MKRLGIRRRLLFAVLAAVLSALAAMIVGFNLLLAHNLAGDADALLRGRASSELGQLSARDGRLEIADAPDDATVPDEWVFSHGKVVEQPRALLRVAVAARELAQHAPGFEDVSGTDTRLYAQPVVQTGKRLGTVVVSISTEPYEQTRHTALLASLGLGAAVLLLVGFAARWLLASSLRPVVRMTRLASEWSERDPERRFAVGDPHDELTELAATLDALLGRLAASLRREQRFSAELSHELRTPLSRVIAETELALRAPRAPEEYRSALELVHANAEQLARTIDVLVAAARHESGALRGTSDAFAVAGAAAEACAGLAAERDVSVEVEVPQQPVRLGVEGDLAERVLQPVVENACRYGRARVQVSISRRGEGVVYRIADDGPGVEEAEREQIFEPGERGGAGAANGGGAGLGLALARRLARSVAGEVTAVAERGGVFLVRLPAA